MAQFGDSYTGSSLYTTMHRALTLISGMSDWLIHLRYIRIHVAGVCIHTGYHGGVCMYTQVIMVESVGDLVVAWLYG